MSPRCIICRRRLSAKAIRNHSQGIGHPWCLRCSRSVVQAIATTAGVCTRTVRRALHGEYVDGFDALKRAAEWLLYPVAWPKQPPPARPSRPTPAPEACPQCTAPLPLTRSHGRVQRKRSCPSTKQVGAF